MDNAGYAYITGYNRYPNFPTTAGAYQTVGRGYEDAFVTKLNATGSALLYSTLLGGSEADEGLGIAVDGAGNAYVTGLTGSADFSTTGAAQASLHGTFDAFVAKLDPTGSALLYSTYLGGTDAESASSIAVDGSGDAYVTGTTLSADFPTTPGSFQPNSGGYRDAFVAKLNPSGSAFLYSTYLGGALYDQATGIAVDGAGNAYVTGNTQSVNFPTSPGAFQVSIGGGYYGDAFVVKLNPAGSALLYSTYLGGSGDEYGYGLAVDGAGDAYVTGSTTSVNFPTTPDAPQTTFGGGVYADAFVAKLNSGGSALLYSTYLGGSGDDPGWAIAVDGTGDGYVTGQTNSTNFPTTSSNIQGGFGGGDYDGFVAKVSIGGGAPNRPGPLEPQGPGGPDENPTTCGHGPYPVNCATGNFWHGFEDLSIPGRGRALHLTHTYNSLVAGQDGPLGFGWTETYNMFASKDATGNVTVHAEEGEQIPFTASGTGYASPGRVLSRLTVNGDGTLTLTRRDQSQLVFAAPAVGTAGQLLREIDRNGYATTLAYVSGKLSTVTDPAGRSLSFFYNAAGRIDHVIDPASRTVSFGYNDGAGNLTDAYDVASGHWHFTYDGGHLLLTMTDPVQELLSQPKAVVNVYYADGSGRVQTQTDPMGRQTGYGYVANGDGSQTSTITDPKGNVTVERYVQNVLQSLTKGSGTPQQATWTYTYDPLTLGLASTTGPDNHVTRNTWDARGNLLIHADGLGRATTYTYDATNDVTSVVDPAGLASYLTYDSHGNLASTTRPLANLLPAASVTATAVPTASPSPVALSEVAAPGGSAPSGLAAGPDGRLWFTEPGTNKIGAMTLAGTTSEYALPSANATPQAIAAGADGALWVTEAGASKIARVTTGGAVAEYALPAGSAPGGIAAGGDGNLWFTEPGTARIGRITTGATPAITQFGLSAGSAPQGIAAGADGRLWFAASGTGRIGAISTAGAVSLWTLPAGSAPAGIAAGADGSLWYTEPGTGKIGHIGTNGALLGEYAPPGGSPKAIMAGPDGSLWFTEPASNQIGRISTGGSIAEFAIPSASSGAAGIGLGADGTPWFAEPALGKLGRVALAVTTTLAYDPAHPGDLTTVTDPDGHVSRYSYDPTRGDITGSADALGDTTTMGYDGIGRVTSIVSPNGNVAGATPTTFTTIIGYNACGDVGSVTDPLLAGQATPGTTVLGYDPNRNLTSMRDANGYTSGYRYDADNERSSVIQPTPTGTPSATPVADGTTYDGDGNLQSHTDFNGHLVTYSYDPLNRLAGVSQPVTQPSPIGPQTRTIDFVYDGAGNRTGMTDPLGHVTIYQYDAANQPTGLSWLNAQGTPVAGTGTAYGADGQVTGSTDADGHTSSYGYDSLGRQVAMADPLNRLTRYLYDPAGNRLLATDAGLRGTAFGYDAANRPVLTTNPDASTGSTGYDAEGNVVNRTDENRHITQLRYNALDRLTALIDARLKQTTYGYDAAGNQTSVQLPLNPATIYSYDQLNRLVGIKDPRNPATAYGYDAVGNLTSAVDALNHLTRYGYDEANERIGTTQPDLSTLGVGYDQDENTILKTDANGHTTGYGYDVLNHPQATTDPLGRTTGYVYDPAGNMTGLTDATQPAGRVTSYGYDAANQLRTIGYSDGATPGVAFTYTATGQRASMADGMGTTAYGYDS